MGIRTVRDVLSELRDQGMIRTEERRPAVIVYGKTGEEDYIPDILAVLQRKTSVLAVYKTNGIADAQDVCIICPGMRWKLPWNISNG